jgi:serine-type D-Ala-D-Ala carboxypeptidase (penicillin-binding protein 5/6)
VRRRRVLLLTAVTLVLAYTAFGMTSSVFSGEANGLGGAAPILKQAQRATGSTVEWPARGQAALALGGGRMAASADEQPAPIASLAKVMTAYLTLQRYPLTGAQGGFTITITGADVQDEADNLSDGQSGVAVQVGEQLTERQLLEALLIPSGNNVAEILADQVAGSKAGFVVRMNAESRALGMRQTHYTDPSGFDPGTVSTAADQLRLIRQAMRFPVFRQIVSMASVALPVAGKLPNFNPLIPEGYDGKTGSDSATGGCLAFFTRVTVRGRPQTAVGVVMGQGLGSNTSEILAAAGQAAQQLVASVTHATYARLVAGTQN